MYNIDEDLIREIIPKGKENAVYFRDIKDLLHIKKRDFVKLISFFRKQGVPICSTTTNGYWIAESKADIKETIRALDSKIDTLIETRSYLYNCIGDFKK